MGSGAKPAAYAPEPDIYISTPAPVVPRPTGFDRAAPLPFRPEPRALWQAEQLGAVFEQSRVRRIERAQDALSLVEEKVYDILWGPRNLRRDEFRLVHYSLQRLSTEARVNIKTVRELIPRLIEKGFIVIENEADPRHNTPTLYRVFSYVSILARQRQRNRFFVVKTGKGVFYAQPLSASLSAGSIPMGFDPPPAAPAPTGSDFPPMGSSQPPVGAAPTAPLGPASPTPMGASGTVSIGTFTDTGLRQTSTTAYAAIVAAIRNAFNVEPDSSLLDATLSDCHSRAIETTGSAATDDELLYFTQSKVRVLAAAPNIRNHLAVLRRALPECFSGPAFRVFREAARQREAAVAEPYPEAAPADEALERELALWTEINERHRTDRGYDLEAIAGDAELNEKGRRIARETMRRIGRYSRTGL